MTDIEFNKELKSYILDLMPMDRKVMRTEFYLNLQPGVTSYGGHFIFADNETIPIDIRRKSKSSNGQFAETVKRFHRQSTKGGLNKWNRALFNVHSDGQVEHKLTWDEIWEREEIDCYKGHTDSVRQKWYWEEK